MAFFDEAEPVFFEVLLPFDVTLWMDVLIFSDDSAKLSVKEERLPEFSISLELSVSFETNSDVSSDETKSEVSSNETGRTEDKSSAPEREESVAEFELEAIFSSDPHAPIVTRITHKDKTSASTLT